MLKKVKRSTKKQKNLKKVDETFFWIKLTNYITKNVKILQKSYCIFFFFFWYKHSKSIVTIINYDY